MAAFIQAVSRWFSVERPFKPLEDDCLVYTFNRFQASRFGLNGVYIDPQTHEQRPLMEEILALLERIEHHASELHALEACESLKKIVERGQNDADWIRDVQLREHSLPEVIR